MRAEASEHTRSPTITYHNRESGAAGTQGQPPLLHRLEQERGGVLAFLLVLFLLVLIRNAWMSDDAYITLRTVHNFTHGFGLRYNIFERVQTYTHPLWMFALSVGYFLTQEAYFTTLTISIVTSFLAVFLFAFRLARSVVAALLGLVMLMSSKAFVDYTTSGLENPLSYLLFVLFCITWFREKTKHKLFWVSFLGALIALNRMDTFLIVIPALAVLFWKNRGFRALGIMALGFSPFILWELFSLFYYGFPFPNTAYAKLGTGISQNELCVQGLYYILNTVSWDPVTLLIIVAGLLLPLVRRRWDLLPLVVGILFYLIYTVKIGGDFMAGRFFSIPLLLSVIVISRLNLSSAFSLCAGIIVLGLSLVFPFSPILSGGDYGKTDNIHSLSDRNGITDERAYYYQSTGLLKAHRLKPVVKPPKVERRDLTTPDSVLLELAIGHYGFSRSVYDHLIDTVALADPLLARLPAVKKDGWRIGHFNRKIPEGYLETLGTGENQIRDEQLAEYYDKLALVTRGPLWSWKRLVTALKLNLGMYDDLIDERFYRKGLRTLVALGEIAYPKKEGSSWNAPGNILLDDEFGVTVDMGKAAGYERIEISLDHNDEYEIVFLKGGTELCTEVVEGKPGLGGLAVFQLQVPSEAVEQGYDRIRVKAISGDGMYSMGHLRAIR